MIPLTKLRNKQYYELCDILSELTYNHRYNYDEFDVYDKETLVGMIRTKQLENLMLQKH